MPPGPQGSGGFLVILPILSIPVAEPSGNMNKRSGSPAWRQTGVPGNQVGSTGRSEEKVSVLPGGALVTDSMLLA